MAISTTTNRSARIGWCSRRLGSREASNETAARLPCAIAGLLAVGLLILLARRLYDLRIGVISGFILATSFSFVFFSRHASADVETITGELAALLLFLKHEDRPAGWWIGLALDHHGHHLTD